MINFSSAFVSGATGFIGSALAERLSREEVRVFCMVRPNSDVKRIEFLQNTEIIEAKSLSDSKFINAIKKASPEIFFNLASYGVNEHNREPIQMFEGNIGVVTRLLMLASDMNIKHFIQAGSCSEYGEIIDKKLIDENVALNSRALYGSAKAAATLYGSAFARRLKLSFLTLRLFGVYGVGEGEHRLIPYLINKLNNNEVVDLTLGEQERDLLYIDDAVIAFITATRANLLKSYSVYNVCSGRPVKIRDVALKIAHLLGKSEDLLGFG